VAGGSGAAGLQRSNGPDGLNPVQKAVDTVLTTDHNAATNPNGISISEVCSIPGRRVKARQIVFVWFCRRTFTTASDSLSGLFHVVQIVSLLGGQYSRSDVQGAVMYLADQGHAFTTCDEEHYKSTAV